MNKIRSNIDEDFYDCHTSSWTEWKFLFLYLYVAVS